jgi:arylformamidase
MLSSLEINGHTYRFDTSNAIDISIPLRFNGPQPNAYGVDPASSEPCAAGELVGDTRRGGSCNFEQYKLIPHCNGTHTECVGHITHERISVRDCLQVAFAQAAVITVEPESPDETDETYSISPSVDDKLITLRSIERALSKLENSKWKSEPGAVATGAFLAFVVRTVPNEREKAAREYLNDVSPYFTTEAMEFLVTIGVEHLLVDLPSIDRLYDEGKLSNHRIFWKVDQGRFELTENSRRNATITELIYVPDEVQDGEYILNLQIAPFETDASPSRPLLFPIRHN